MLSYQHAYHAGNLADVHKHAALAWVLAYLAAKDKPLSYMETHAGRGLYALDAPEALKTSEAESGILRLEPCFAPDHPYLRAINATRALHGPQAYPGSPLIAALLLREDDSLTLAELHPQEHKSLSGVFSKCPARIFQRDGLEMAQALCPPTPRRGLMMIDPSYEVKSDYAALPGFLSAIRRKWNVGILMLWYPILQSGLHLPMCAALRERHPDLLLSETRFPPVREGHRMIGSGLAVINPPWGMADALAEIDRLIRNATS